LAAVSPHVISTVGLLRVFAVMQNFAMIDSLKISFEEKPERDDRKFIADNIDK
jgi:hypothetical protein